MSKNLLNILLAVASFALYYIIINPLYTGRGSVWQPQYGLTTLRSTNTQYDDTLQQAESLLQDAKQLSAKYKSISQETKDTMKVMVPNQADMDPVRLVSEVDSIAARTGLSISDLNYSEGQVIGNRGVYTISFTVKTTYTKFKELMRNFETSLRLFTIQSVQFSVPETDGNLIVFQVKMDTYYIK